MYVLNWFQEENKIIIVSSDHHKPQDQLSLLAVAHFNVNMPWEEFFCLLRCQEETCKMIEWIIYDERTHIQKQILRTATRGYQKLHRLLGQ